MTEVQELAEFVERARLPDLSEKAAEQRPAPNRSR